MQHVKTRIPELKEADPVNIKCQRWRYSQVDWLLLGQKTVFDRLKVNEDIITYVNEDESITIYEAQSFRMTV